MEIRVVSFNIRCANDAHGHSVAKRAPRLYSAIRDINADVIAFQEYNPRWERHIRGFFGGEYVIFNKYRGDAESTPILWRRDKFICRSSGWFWLSDTPDVPSGGWDELYGLNRICLYAVLEEKDNGLAFAVMNTHFGFGSAGQVKSAALISSRAAYISNLPTVVVGDFNMTDKSAGYAAMTRMFADANIANDARPTFHGYDPNGREASRIDYCFVGNGAVSVGQTMIDATFGGKYPSDHFGLCTTVRI